MKARIVLALLLTSVCAAVAYQVRATRQKAVPTSLTAYVPQDALLTIESPDFASLLHQWTTSAESKAWLASDNHAVFQNSRLYGRLGDAQASFAKAAGVPTGSDLLAQVAGKASVFAWYDITKLEFLYITRMPAAQADQIQLFESRGSFERRHAGNVDFYIRTSGTSYSTVAFARVPTPAGELLLLATREDLIANALQLIASASSTNSIQQEPWFRDVSAALPAEKATPALHMVLNLDRIAVDPHFRSYWIQRNITWTKQFRAAASDLYIDPSRFREERVLLPRSPDSTPPAPADLNSLAALVPPFTGIFRAVATNNPADAVKAIQEKLFGAPSASSQSSQYAPNPVLGAQPTGSTDDLETRIDTLPPVSPSASTSSLAKSFESAGLDATLTLSSAQDPVEKDGLWVPIHSAVVLHTVKPVDPQTLAAALQQTLRGALTVADTGISFHHTQSAENSIYSLSGPRPLFFAITSTEAAGNLVLITEDQALLSALLHQVTQLPLKQTSQAATLIAVFNHSSQRAPYLRLTSLIDSTNKQALSSSGGSSTGSNSPDGSTSVPAFFSQNIRSLSDTFATLESERVVERLVDSNLRQTVIYTWTTP